MCFNMYVDIIRKLGCMIIKDKVSFICQAMRLRLMARVFVTNLPEF